MSAFETKPYRYYQGANFYLERQAFVFDLLSAPEGRDLEIVRKEAERVFPVLKKAKVKDAANLFAETLLHVLKMDINLSVDHSDVSRNGHGWRIAVECVDRDITDRCVTEIEYWFNQVLDDREHDFAKVFGEIQQKFDRSLLGGPTIYSLYEGARKRGIPVHFIEEENQFQWGYGCKQIRGRSTIVSTDGIKDTEFTTYKDMVGEFLASRGFPTPVSKTFFTEEEVVEEAEKLGWPVVVKPVAGHKGHGVTTNIRTERDVRRAFRVAMETGEESSDGIIVQQQIEGTDHRLLTVKGKFVAALQRVPAYVDGDGDGTIGELIAKENDTPARIDNARSPLCKIKVDDDLIDYLDKQNLALNSVPHKGQRIFLRRVANISAGGVSINVTDKIHPMNIKLVEDIAANFNVTCLGVDVLCGDIAVPWREGNFGIIEINAGPGVFMHLVPAIGDSVDVPGHIMKSYFPKERCERIPIIAGNSITLGLCNKLFKEAKKLRPSQMFSSLTEEGIYLDGEYFHKNPRHDENLRIILRHPKLGMLMARHTAEEIEEFGMYHQGADVVVLQGATEVEEIMKRDIVKDGYLVKVEAGQVNLSRGGKVVQKVSLEGKGKGSAKEKEAAILKVLVPLVPELLEKYGRRFDDPSR